MGRCRSLAFVLPLLLLAGCGGHHDSTPTPVPVAVLGSASLDLAIAGNDTDKTMVGTGDAPGSLSITDPNPALAGTTTTVVATLSHGDPKIEIYVQTLQLRLAHPSGLAVGTTIPIDGTASVADYLEESIEGSDSPFAGESGTYPRRATGGTVEVVALSGLAITLRLTDVAFSQAGSPGSEITLSGTITGTISPPAN